MAMRPVSDSGTFAPGDRAHRHAPLRVFAGPEAGALVTASLRDWGVARPIVVVPGQAFRLAQRIADLAEGRVVQPLATITIRRADRFLAVGLEGRGERLSHAWLAQELVTTDPIAAVNDLDAPRTPRDPIAIGIWARFARPDQRLGARLSDDRDGLTAEIALAVRPAAIVLAATVRGIPIVAVTADQIAAELAGLALLHLKGPDDGERSGPWEHPLVQRATELRLGVLTPSMIDLSAIWCGGDDAKLAEFTRLLAELAGMIGLPTPEIWRLDGILMS